MRDIVMLKLSVESMKHEMIHAFTKHNLEIEDAINKACDHYINSGQMYLDIDAAFQAAVKSAISSYWRFGEGHDQISASIKEALANSFKKPNDSQE